MTWPTTILWATGIIKSTFFMTRKLGHLCTKWIACDDSYCSEIRKVLHDLTWRNRVGKHLCRQINNRNTSYVRHTNTIFPWGKKNKCLNFLGGKRHISYPTPHYPLPEQQPRKERRCSTDHSVLTALSALGLCDPCLWNTDHLPLQPACSASVVRNCTWVIFHFISLYVFHDWTSCSVSFCIWILNVH